MSEAIKNLNESNFESTISAGTPVVVDFWAPWCGPCRTIAPILEEIATEMGDAVVISKVNVDESPALAQKFGVQSIPTLLFFKDGKIKDMAVGLMPKDALVKRIKGL